MRLLRIVGFLRMKDATGYIVTWIWTLLLPGAKDFLR